MEPPKPPRHSGNSNNSTLPDRTSDASASPAFTSIEEISGVSHRLQSDGRESPPLSNRVLDQAPSVAEVNRVQNAFASLHVSRLPIQNSSHDPAPDIESFYPQLADQFNSMLTPQDAICLLLKNKNNSIKSEWIFEWLARHREDFKDKEDLQNIFSSLVTWTDTHHLVVFTSKDAETLSFLVLKLCLCKESTASFVAICKLIGRFQPCVNFSILTKEARALLISTFLQPSLKDLPNEDIRIIFSALYLFAERNELDPFDRNQTDVLASLIIKNASTPLPPPLTLISPHLTSLRFQTLNSLALMTSEMKIPNLLSSLLLQGDELPPHKLLKLCRIWLHSKIELEPSARAKLIAVIAEIEREPVPDLESTNEAVGDDMHDDNPEDDDVQRTDPRDVRIDKIVKALKTYSRIAQAADLFPLTSEELEVIIKLVNQLLPLEIPALSLEPDSVAIDKVIESLLPLFQRQEVKGPLKGAVVNLIGNAAVDISLMDCLRPGSSCYHMLEYFAQWDLHAYESIMKALREVLKDTTTHESSAPYPFSVRIATAVHIAGLLMASPLHQDNTEVINTAFNTLSIILSPEEKPVSKDLHTLICQLFDTFAKTEPDPQQIVHFFTGLGMLVCSSTLPGLPQDQKTRQKVNALLLRFIEKAALDELHEGVEILLWFSNMAQCDRLPSIPGSSAENPYLQWIDLLLIELAQPLQKNCVPQCAILKLLRVLGSLTSRGRVPVLSMNGTSVLMQLILTNSAWSLSRSYKEIMFKKCPVFLQAVRQLIENKLAPPHVVSHLLKSQLASALSEENCSHYTSDQLATILSFIEKFQITEPSPDFIYLPHGKMMAQRQNKKLYKAITGMQAKLYHYLSKRQITTIMK